VIERFDWTDHAERRLREREFHRINVEMAIRLGHDGRNRNDGSADWLVLGQRLVGASFVVVYDHPVGEDHDRVRIVSVWDLEERGTS
jgi:hypothetical protein